MPIGKRADANRPIRIFEYAVAKPDEPALVLQIAREIVGVVRRLESDEVVGRQLRNEPFMVGQCRQNVRRRKRDVQEEADPVAVTAIAQHFGERDQMVVVHPDDIVVAQDVVQLSRELRVDAPIAAEIAARKLREIEPIMQDRPQHAIGKAAVIFLIVRIDQVRHDVGDTAAFDGLGHDIVFVGNLPAPAEPDARTALQQRAHGDRQAAGLAVAVTRDRNTIGNNDQPRQ